MWQFVRSRLLLVITLVSAAHGLLVVGPKYIRSNQNYTLVLTNFNASMGRVDLKVQIDGTTDGGETILGLTRTVDVRRFQNRLVNFEFPDLVPGSYKITLNGQRGFSFHKEAELVLKNKSVSALIQLDKPVYKPGDMVNFRVIVLDTDLKPPVNVKTVNVTIQDPRGNVIRKWSAGRLHVGVFENKLEIAPTPLMGKFKMTVKVGGEELVTKSFEVKEYVLSTFEIDVYPTQVPLVEEKALDLTVDAKYFTGKPVQGTAVLQLYLSDGILDQTKSWDVDGVGQALLRFNSPLDFYEAQHDVQVTFTFIEKYTNRTLTIHKPITVYKYQYRVELVKESPTFRPGMPYKCDIHVKYHNGTPAANVETEVTIFGLDNEYVKTLTSDKNGVIKQTLLPLADAETINIEVKIEDNELLNEDIEKVEVATDAYVKIELKSKIMLNKPIKYSITCTDKMQFLVYYVVSKGNIIDEGFIRPSKTTKVQLQINANSKMIPKSKIIIATLAKDTIVYDTMDIEFKELSNNFKMTIDEQDREVKPGRQIELIMQGRPRSYVALAAYDKSLLQHNDNHDVNWGNIEAVFDGFHDLQLNEYDKIHSMGLFARTLDSFKLEGASDKLGRLESNGSAAKLIPYRTYFLESFLWKNLTIPINGQRKLIENVPESTTAWSLTGFSIDPVYGLGIIKEPIEFTTVQSFYIVDNLPYSIKRGEAVALQFTLFNNLGGEYIADVTMYNVGNQIEFVGQPAGTSSYTKSISVKPKVGVPISFLVKAKKLGEIAVRLKASIMLGQETDAIEKVIRVLPESLVEKRMESRIFSQNKYVNTSFPIILDINKNADVGSAQISFYVNPNILTTVVQNLGELLDVPSGCGEQNMVNFVPNIIVLDYLTAIGSKETSVINKATGMLRTGYQNQMRYRQTDGSFGVWSSGGGSVFLTAFVAKSMQIASKYISEVDGTMVANAFQWLATKQKYDGRFDEVGSVIHKDMQGGLRNGIALTSYVLIAFLENENAKVTHAKVIENSITYIARHLPQVTDIYDLSIATYAMMLSNYNQNQKENFMKKLIDRSTVYGNGTIRYWARHSHEIETTGYALLAMVQDEKYPDSIPVMRWLVNQRHPKGSFPRTQDTFVGLKSLTKLAEVISPSRNDYSIQLKYKTQSKMFFITSTEVEQRKFEDIPSEVRKLDMIVAGMGFGLLDIKYEYTMDLRNYKNRFDLTLEKLNNNSDYELKLRICANFIPKLVNERSNMALVEVNFPSGYVVDPRPITEATTVNPIRNTEIRFGGTAVVAYYNNMGTEKNCFVITAYRRFKVALKRPAYVLVHDYYEPKLNAIQVYDVDQENLCDICDKEDCPPECNK